MCYGKGYWKNHNRFAANPSQNKPWPADENTALCGTTWHQMIGESNGGDVWDILGQHWVATKLNVANGGFVPNDIASALIMSEALLVNCSINNNDRDFALGLKDTLEAYNDSPDCLENPVEPQPTAATVHIRSVYDFNGEDMSALGVVNMANPMLLPMDQRSERFIRIYTQNLEGATVLSGYAPIQPDGSVMFEMLPHTRFTFEVVNVQAKALNNDQSQMVGSEFPYTYMQRFTGWLEVVDEEQKELNGFNVTNSATAVNLGAAQVGAFPNTSTQIQAQSVGQTMAQALYAGVEGFGKLTPSMIYNDYWTPGPVQGSNRIDLDYTQLTTPSPVNAVCELSNASDCVANISYEQHIKPLWNNVVRNDAGNSCVDCHDNRGFTSLDLSDFSSQVEGLASYNALFDNNRTYMYLASTFSEVNETHCRRYVEAPFVMQPENDCFSCYGQALMNPLGAISSANFFDVFAQDADHDHWIFRPIAVEESKQDVLQQHKNMLTPQERKLIAEWLDMGAPK